MGRYIDWDDVVARYPSISTVGGALEVNTSYIQYAEAMVDGRLSSKFTIPFSDNNLTVKDLCIEMVYKRAGNLSTKESDKIGAWLEARFKGLLEGDENMITSSGDIIQKSTGGLVWSSTENYHPTFGVGNTLSFEVDSSQIEAEEDARG